MAWVIRRRGCARWPRSTPVAKPGRVQDESLCCSFPDATQAPLETLVTQIRPIRTVSLLLGTPWVGRVRAITRRIEAARATFAGWPPTCWGRSHVVVRTSAAAGPGGGVLAHAKVGRRDGDCLSQLVGLDTAIFMSHSWDMNIEAARPYRMTVRAARVAETGERIVAASLELYGELWLDEITLDKVAERAGVSTKTLQRRYGDRDGLVRSVSETLAGRVAAQRFDARPGDVDDAVANLVTHYESVGTLALRNMVQAQRFPQIAALVQYGRDEHHRWVRHVFARWLERSGDAADGVLFLQLFTITDVTVWRLLRSDLRLDPQQTQHIIRGLLVAVLGEEPA